MYTLESLGKSELGGQKLGQYPLVFSVTPSSKLLSNKITNKDITIHNKLKGSRCLQAPCLEK